MTMNCKHEYYLAVIKNHYSKTVRNGYSCRLCGELHPQELFHQRERAMSGM